MGYSLTSTILCIKLLNSSRVIHTSFLVGPFCLAQDKYKASNMGKYVFKKLSTFSL